MASNSGTIQNRSNENAPFFQAIKSRNSKSLPELYSSEINTEPMAQSRVEVESSSASGYNRTLRISLPRYGILNRLYVYTSFGPSTFVASSTVAVQFVPFIGAFFAKEYRLMYNGSVLAKLNPETIVADLWKHENDLNKKKLQELLGAFNQTAGTFNTNADKHNAANERRQIVGSAPHDGKSQYYCPLDFFFSAKHSPNRGLDLSVLANEVILEIDVDSSSNIWKQDTPASSTVPELTNVKAVCYLTELDLETEKQFRSLQYQAGGSPLTQLCYDTSHVIVSTNVSTAASTDKIIDVKLNQFTGQVSKLVVYATAPDDFQTNRHRILPLNIKEIQLKATGSNIVNMDQLTDKEDILEHYHSGGDYYAVTEQTNKYFSSITCNPNNFYEITFKHPYDMSKVSSSGSLAFGQLSVPSLRVVVSGVHNYGAQSDLAGSGGFDLHVIAYQTALISYNTNTSGSTHIRQIMN